VLESAPHGPGAGGADTEGNLGLAFAREAMVAPASDLCSTMVLVVAGVLAGERVAHSRLGILQSLGFEQKKLRLGRGGVGWRGGGGWGTRSSSE
jgi:hypothetical protein